MIRIQPKPEYAEFEDQVRGPGQKFLAVNPNPTSKDFKSHNYWSKAAKQLLSVYGGNCAYTSLRMVDGATVDHFRPKVAYPHLAYEWDNYRLARAKINNRKGDLENVLDPFEVEPGWFHLNLPSCLIIPADGLPRPIRLSINQTINILQLNNDDLLVQERCDLLVDLADELITLGFLDRHYPFLSHEVRRQGVAADLKKIFARP